MFQRGNVLLVSHKTYFVSAFKQSVARWNYQISVLHDKGKQHFPGQFQIPECLARYGRTRTDGQVDDFNIVFIEIIDGADMRFADCLENGGDNRVV